MKLSREDAKKYKDELTEKYYKKEISVKEFSRLWDEIELLPYDLSAFPLVSEETAKWINILFQDISETDKNGNYMLRGFTRNPDMEMQKLDLSYGDYADGLSFYAYNDLEMLLYSYCEGDTTLKIFSDKETYEREKEADRQWFEEQRG